MYDLEPHKGYLYASLFLWVIAICIIMVLVEADEYSPALWSMTILIGAFILSQMAYTHGKISVKREGC